MKKIVFITLHYYLLLFLTRCVEHTCPLLIYLIKFSIAPLYKILNPIKILKRKRKRISRYIMEGNGGGQKIQRPVGVVLHEWAQHYGIICGSLMNHCHGHMKCHLSKRQKVGAYAVQRLVFPSWRGVHLLNPMWQFFQLLRCPS